MKLAAIANRGNQAKDFVDIYYLLKEISLENMFDYYKDKYKQSDIFHIKKSLIFFDDVSDESWKSVHMTHDTISVDTIKKTLQTELEKVEAKDIV
jgi:hypothetical protein